MLQMTSSIPDTRVQTSSSVNNLYNNIAESSMLTYSSAVTDNNAPITNNNNNNNKNDSTNLLAISMLNQALNLNMLPQNDVDQQTHIPSLKFPEMHTKLPANQNVGDIIANLASEYQKIRQSIDKSGLLSPNENLVTKNRGHCYWSQCYFHSDIEENFKKHLTDCHQLSLSTIAQLEISLEKSLQLSQMLIKEQNHLYNMLLHLDQKLKCLPIEPSSLRDYHYLSFILNKIKHTPPFIESTSHSRLSHPVPVYRNHHSVSHSQHSSTIPSPIFSQNLIHNLSSVLLQQQQQQQQLQQQPYPHNTHYQQPLFSTCNIAQPNPSFNGYISPNNRLEIDTHQTPSCHELNINNNSNTNLKDILSQSPSSLSNYPRLRATASTYIKDKKNKTHRPALSDDHSQHSSKNTVDRDYYRQYAVRPSISYVNLIKTAILESSRCELSLNEIYVWMQAEFAYFRDREQKWKNAIRHNLSLHKCFQRKHGKLWTFNESEYNLKKSRNRLQYPVPRTGSGVLTVNDDFFNDNDEEIAECGIKKEVEYNTEHGNSEITQNKEEWSNYFQINDITMLPKRSDECCPVIDNY